MQSISFFLDKFKKLEHPDQKKEVLSNFIFTETGLSLKKEDINLRGRVLFLKTDPYIKNEIFMRREKLLAKMSESLIGFRVEDIR